MTNKDDKNNSKIKSIIVIVAMAILAVSSTISLKNTIENRKKAENPTSRQTYTYTIVGELSKSEVCQVLSAATQGWQPKDSAKNGTLEFEIQGFDNQNYDVFISAILKNANYPKFDVEYKFIVEHNGKRLINKGVAAK